jgi:hypothetical protein
MNRAPAGVPAAGEELERPGGAGTPSACGGIFAVVPVVSLVPRSTTGYKLESLRDKGSASVINHVVSSKFSELNLLCRFDQSELVE